MTYTFKYVTVGRPGLPPAKVPHLAITMHGPKGQVFNTAALVDSGADTCAMPRSVAEILGLDLEGVEETQIASASGFVKARRVQTEVSVNLPHGRKRLMLDFNVIMCDFEPPVILGRDGFFDNFVISFNEKEKKFTLKPL